MGSSNGKEENSENNKLDINSLSNKKDKIKCEKATEKCEPCQVGEVENEAEAFCVGCAEFLCAECARDHRKNKLTRKHIDLDGNNKQEDSNVFKTMKSMVSCKEHPEEEVSYKCEEDGTFICHKCFAVSHRKCENIKELGSASVQENECARTVLMEELKENHAATISTKESKKRNVKLLLEKQKIVKQERVRFIKYLVEISEKLDKETEALVMKEKDALDIDIDMCKDIEQEEAFNKELVDNVVKSKSPVWINVLCDLVDKDINLLKAKTNVIRKKEKVSLQFKPSPDFQILKEISSMGEVHIIQGGVPVEPVIDDEEVKLELASDAVEEAEIASGLNNENTTGIINNGSKRRSYHKRQNRKKLTNKEVCIKKNRAIAMRKL